MKQNVLVQTNLTDTFCFIFFKLMVIKNKKLFKLVNIEIGIVLAYSHWYGMIQILTATLRM